MQKGVNQQLHEELAHEKWGRTRPEKPWVVRPMPTGLGYFWAGSTFPLTYTPLRY
jgi:hypothetical protein